MQLGAFASAAPSTTHCGQHALSSPTPKSPPKHKVNIPKWLRYIPMQKISRCRDCLSKSMLPSRGRGEKKKKKKTTQLFYFSVNSPALFKQTVAGVLAERQQFTIVGIPATMGEWISPGLVSQSRLSTSTGGRKRAGSNPDCPLLNQAQAISETSPWLLLSCS